MQTIDEICTILQQLARAQQSVTLLNAYKGIPISSQALILEAVDVAINVQTDRRQIVCIQADQGTFIQSPYLEKTIRAYTLQLDLPNTRAALTDYEIVSGEIGIRTQVRVAPTEPIKGTLKVTGLEKAYKVDVADISLNGIGLHIEEYLFNANILHKGVPVMVTLVLPGTYRQGGSTPTLTPIDQHNLPSSASLRINPLSSLSRQEMPKTAMLNRAVLQETTSPELKIKGLLVNARRDPVYKSYRLGLTLQTEEFSRAILTQYISQRQNDIIRDLNRVYEDLLHASK